MEIQFIEKEGVVVATVSGRMDTLTAPDFEKGMAPCLTEGGSLVLDFSGLEYISSAGPVSPRPKRGFNGNQR